MILFKDKEFSVCAASRVIRLSHADTANLRSSRSGLDGLLQLQVTQGAAPRYGRMILGKQSPIRVNVGQ